MAATNRRKPRWCLVGNIVSERPGETRDPKSFAPGAKVYCLPAPWGDGYEQITVIGHHQQANRFVAMVTSGDRIENWRAQAVYNAEVMRLLEKAARDSGRPAWSSRQEVTAYVEAIRKHLAARER